ncbi:MAG: sensor histidine kinase [Saprospiraceae bacterium]
MNIKQLWQKITNIGVDEEHLGRSVIKVRLLNQLMFLTLTTSSLIVISYILTNEGWVIIATTSLNIIIEVFVLSLAYRQRHNAARHFSCILFPTAIAFNVVANGGGFGESNIFLALGFTAFILYEGQKKLQIPAVFYITALFVFSKLYIINYHSTTPNTINPYDEIITFPTILIALGLLIVIYQNEIKRYDKQNKLALKALEIKNNQLAQINSELEQFSYIASHDLKTPLRTITSHLGLIKWHIKKQNFEAIEKDIIFAQNGAKQMYTLISDILEYKQVSNNDEAIQLVNLEEVALQVVQQIDSFIKEKDAIIEIEELPSISVKHVDMIVLFQNILENGIKYNKSKPPKVIITATVIKNLLTLQFIDNGIGIDAIYHDRIFQFFKRLHRPDEYEGTGIGLGLCKKIIQNYNGKISVKANPTGGSIFEIELPIS